MLKLLKRGFLQSCRSVGAFGVISRSRWRQGSLLILGYHGVSLDDEHLWDPRLYMSPDHFNLRMQTIRASDCAVLPLGEAIERLYSNDLPPRSVAITVDDGFYDFKARAYPILEQYGFPVTLYQTTYYACYNRPIFDVMCSYLLWRGRHSSIDGLEFRGRPGLLDLTTESQRLKVQGDILEFVRVANFSAEDKDDLALLFAQKAKVDYEALLGRRMLHLLRPEEIQGLARNGVDVQLHTHRHRTPRNRDSFILEVQQNKELLESLTQTPRVHFCYPSGDHVPVFAEWLGSCGVRSATTCKPGLAKRQSDPFFLPRLIDTSLLSSVEFEGWLSGFSELLPSKPVR